MLPLLLILNEIADGISEREWALPATAFESDDSEIEFSGQISVRAEVRRDPGFISIQISAMGPIVCSCARCLEVIADQVQAESSMVFEEGKDQDPSNPVWRAEEGAIDLSGDVRDILVLELPSKPLCRADCRGLCIGCGANLNQGACACRTDETDPRWAALRALRGPSPEAPDA